MLTAATIAGTMQQTITGGTTITNGRKTLLLILFSDKAGSGGTAVGSGGNAVGSGENVVVSVGGKIIEHNYPN